MTMTESKPISLKDFMQSRKPGGTHGLAFFRDDIITLYASGYSLTSILDYVQANGYQGGYSAMCKWVSKNMNLKQEAIELMKNGGVKVEKAASPLSAPPAATNNSKPAKAKDSPEKATDKEPETKANKVSPRETSSEPLPDSKEERIAKMKASMDRLLNEESYDEQFAALGKNED